MVLDKSRFGSGSTTVNSYCGGDRKLIPLGVILGFLLVTVLRLRGIVACQDLKDLNDDGSAARYQFKPNRVSWQRLSSGGDHNLSWQCWQAKGPNL